MRKARPIRFTQEWVTIVLLALAVLCLVYTVASLIRYRLTSARTLAITPVSLAQADPNESLLNNYLAADRDHAEALKKSNFYAPAPPPCNPVSQVQGIMGDEALINGQWYKVGAEVGDATIVAITADSVTVEWKGQKTSLSPLDGQGSANGAAGPPGGPDGGARPGMPPNVVMSSGPPPISPEEMERLRSLPPEEQRAFVEARMKSMSR